VSPTLVESSWQDQRIKVGADLETVRDQVQDGHIVILKHAVSAGALRSMRQAVHLWGQQTPERTGDIRGNNDQRTGPGSWHGHEIWPPNERPAQRLWHGYAFILSAENPTEVMIASRVRWMFDAMRDLHERLTGLHAQYTHGGTGGVLRPQILHYPSGGGVRAQWPCVKPYRKPAACGNWYAMSRDRHGRGPNPRPLGSEPVNGTAATPPSSARSSACPNQAATFSPAATSSPSPTTLWTPASTTASATSASSARTCGTR
jgi:hypothetical protein